MQAAQNRLNLTEFVGNLSRFLRKCIFSVLSVGPIPIHIAFIMDGNRRYAKKRNLKEVDAYKVGFLTLLSMLKYCYELGVKYVTVYAFSIDNFKRRPEQIQLLMNLMEEKIEYLIKEEEFLKNYGVKIHFLGNLKLLNESTRTAAKKAMSATAKNKKVVLLICVAYSSTDEIVHAIEEAYVKKQDRVQESDCGSSDRLIPVTKSGIEHDPAIRVVDIERNMYMDVGPAPDILVRTSGATRLSNFLLWQTTHTYLYSPFALWPEMSLWHLVWGILNFQLVHPYLEKKKKSN